LGFVVVMFAANKMGVRSLLFYALLGIGGVWGAFLLSGVHATIAAVLAAFTIPADTLKKVERMLLPFVTFVVLPVFALANAGVSFAGVSLGSLFESNVMPGVFAGLLLGKAVGIFGASYLLVKLRVATLYNGMTRRNLLGVSVLGSIGFTMSLFITALAFTNETHTTQAKIGIFAASIVGGVAGYLILRNGTKVIKET